MFTSERNSGNQQHLLTDANSNNDHSIQLSSKKKLDERYIDALEEEHKSTRKYLCFSWKCCCLTSAITLTVAILTLFLVLYFSVAPKFAQSVLDNASMQIVNGTISNPTNTSITLTTTIEISNAGFLDGSIKSFPVTVYYDNIEVGRMQMPELNTIANQNTYVTATSVLAITNITQFQKTTGGLLQNEAQTWHLSGSGIILTVDTGFMGKIDYTVNVEKDLTLKGVDLYDIVANDFNVASTTKDTCNSTTDLNMKSNSDFTFLLPDALMKLYQNGTYIGYSPLKAFPLVPGLNKIPGQSIVIEQTEENEDLLNGFFSAYIAGERQKVLMKGPVPGFADGIEYPSTVLDGIFEEDVIAIGYAGHSLASLHIFNSTVSLKFAQSALDNANIQIVNGTISNPTNTSITLTTTIETSNAGFFDGSIESFPVTVYYDNIEVGHMQMPQLNTIANQNTYVTATLVLTITNITQFQKTTRGLLQNEAQIWHLSAAGITLTLDTGVMGKIDYTVDVEKDLILKGVNLYDIVANDFNVASATNDTCYSATDLNMRSNSIFTFDLPDALMKLYQNGTYIGYAPLKAFSLRPGLNQIPGQSIVIEQTEENKDLLNDFFSGYIAGENQKVLMKGPVPGTVDGIEYPSTVLDGILEEYVIVMGYAGDPLAFGGLVTSTTQQGWKNADDKTLRGAYANFLNPLNVPLKITNLSGLATLPKENWFNYTVSILLTPYHCSANTFAALSIGPGIYKDNLTKSWVDIKPNEKVTYFSIMDPPAGTHEGDCMGMYPFDCCFATLSTAYACYLNPGIQKHPSDGQLTSDYMPLLLDANITMKIDNEFEVNTTYNPDGGFPLYFGWQVYGGYLSDADLSCTSFKFY